MTKAEKLFRENERIFEEAEGLKRSIRPQPVLPLKGGDVAIEWNREGKPSLSVRGSGLDFADVLSIAAFAEEWLTWLPEDEPS